MFKALKTFGYLGLLIFATSGCVPLVLGAAAGAGGYAYVRGELERNFDNSVKDIHKATLRALKTQDVFVQMDELNLHSAKFRGEYEDGKSVTVNIESLTERSSKVKIRVGTFGDEVKSQGLMNAIERKL